MEEFLKEFERFRSVNVCEYADISSFNFSNMFSCNSFKILHVNIRSYRKHIDEFIVILASLCYKFDFIVLTETWQDNSGMIVSMEGYEVISNKHSRTQNDGIIVYVNKSMFVRSEDVYLHGATGMRVDVKFGSERASLLCLYRSPSPDNDLDIFINDLEAYCDSRPGEGSRWIVGDVNCCILEHKNALSQRYLDALYGAGYVSCISVPTRVTAFTSTSIDHIFTDIKDTACVRSAVVGAEMTDHYFIIAGINLSTDKDNTMKTKVKDISYLDSVSARGRILETDWNVFTTIKDVNICTEAFVEKLQEIITESTKYRKITSKNRKLKPWITSGLINSIRERDRLSKRVKKQPFNPELRDYFKNYRNTLTTTIKFAKEGYYRHKLSEAKGNGRILWQSIGEIMGNKSIKQPFPIKEFLNSSEIVDEGDIEKAANVLNEYYVGVGAGLAGAIPPVSVPVVNDEEYGTDSAFGLEPVTGEELTRCVHDMRARSAPGLDNIPGSLVKDNFDVLISPILHIG